MIKITGEEWIKKGTELFGKDRTEWVIVCPSCKTKQTAKDFEALGMKPGEVAKSIGFSCIGRFTKEKGCDWSLGGFFQIHKLELILDDGKTHPIFEFYEVEKHG